MAQPSSEPSSTPPPASLTKAPTPETNVYSSHWRARSQKMRTSTSAVPSFMSASPATSVERCGDAPTRLSTASAATGSVAEVIAPSVIAS